MVRKKQVILFAQTPQETAQKADTYGTVYNFRKSSLVAQIILRDTPNYIKCLRDASCARDGTHCFKKGHKPLTLDTATEVLGYSVNGKACRAFGLRCHAQTKLKIRKIRTSRFGFQRY